MAKYEVNEDTNDKNYGIYDYFKLEGYHKSLGVILPNKYVFKTGIGDHYVSHMNYQDEEGPYNIWVCADSNYLGIQYICDVCDEITPFQYESAIGVLKECRRYIKETGSEITLDVTERLFTTDDMLDEKHDVDKIIADIEIKYNMMFGKKK